MRKPDSHKGENGKVIVIGGSQTYTGAPYFSALAALRIGADLVTVISLSSVADHVKSLCPDLIAIGLPGNHLGKEHESIIIEEMSKADVAVIGPGMTPESDELINLLVQQGMQKVIDAEALRTIDFKDVHNAVLTPHHDEYTTLLSHAGREEEAVQDILQENILLVKGHEDKVISKDDIVIITGGNPGMTVGGTGDLLAGLVAGFISQGLDRFTAAQKASKLNKQIGDRLQASLGDGFIASDFLKLIAEEQLLMERAD